VTVEDATSNGLAALFTIHRSELLRFLAARCGDRDEAQDLIQELWIKAGSAAAAPIANGRAYLFRMANNLVLDRRRSQHRTMARDRIWLSEGSGDEGAGFNRADPAAPPDEALVRKQERALIEHAIAKLPPGAQRALRLHRIDGHPQSEVAAIMGISRSGVEKHLALAMRHLRDALADCGYFAGATSQVKQGNSGRRIKGIGGT
jgi:RNA polymerase sigma factor (sigma-70 family)